LLLTFCINLGDKFGCYGVYIRSSRRSSCLTTNQRDEESSRHIAWKDGARPLQKGAVASRWNDRRLCEHTSRECAADRRFSGRLGAGARRRREHLLCEPADPGGDLDGPRWSLQPQKAARHLVDVHIGPGRGCCAVDRGARASPPPLFSGSAHSQPKSSQDTATLHGGEGRPGWSFFDELCARIAPEAQARHGQPKTCPSCCQEEGRGTGGKEVVCRPAPRTSCEGQ